MAQLKATTLQWEAVPRRDIVILHGDRRLRGFVRATGSDTLEWTSPLYILEIA
jgi:hypothetical protein